MVTLEKEQSLKAEDLLSLQYRALGHNGLGITEIRLIDQRKQIYVKTEEDFVKEALKYLGGNAYVGINPRKIESGTDSDVSYLSAVVIDIDPVRPRAEPSTEEQHKEALSIGEKITKDNPSSFIISSGSGCHVYFPLTPQEVKSKDNLKESIKTWIGDIRKKYATPTQKIDHIFDLSRVIRIWGSYNTKSSRVCGPVHDVSTSFRFPIVFSQESRPAQELSQGPGQLINLIDGDTELRDRFSRICLTNPIMQRIMGGTSNFDSRSEADFAFISCLIRAHFPVQDIEKLVLLNPQGRKHECKKEDIKRIISKITKEGLETTSMAYDRSTYFDSLKDRKMGLLTGFSQFDEMVSGLKPTKVIVFAARPTDGKTTIATQILTNIALQGKTCLLFPTEIGAEPIYDKILSRRTGISLKKFQNGAFTQQDLDRIGKERDFLSSLPLVVCEDFALTVETIEQKINEVAPQVVAIDFIQAMDYSGCHGSGDVAVKMSNNVLKIKEMANTYKIPILLFSQLKRGDVKMDLGMLKGSGALEEFTDIISFLFCDDKLKYPRPVSLAIMKSKYSATGIIDMHFYASTCEFKEAVTETN